MYKTVTGVIIRETNFSESDKYISLLTDNFGKIDVLVRSARKKNGKFASNTSIFTYGTFTLFENKGYFSLNDVNIIHIFFELTKDIEKYALACYFCEIIDVICNNHISTSETLELFLRSIYMIATNKYPINIIKSVFELKVLSISGITPRLDICSICHKSKNLSSPIFHISEAVITCADCNPKEYIGETIVMSPSLVNVMFYIISSPIHKIFSFKLGLDTTKTLQYLCEKFLYIHTNKNYKTLEFYKSITGE